VGPQHHLYPSNSRLGGPGARPLWIGGGGGGSELGRPGGARRNLFLWFTDAYRSTDVFSLGFYHNEWRSLWIGYYYWYWYWYWY
jgi:hypothetical protein